MKIAPLELIQTREKEHQLIEDLIRSEARIHGALKVLEAGCGRRWPYNLEDIDFELTGVDIDAAALEIRKNTLSDLHQVIEGDICTADLVGKSYDVIYCSYVLEHVPRADLAVKNFVKWLKPNGIIVIRIPDRDSVQGFVARLSPHWFHVFYYRQLIGQKNAGTPGYAPYPTFFHKIVSRKGIHKFCENPGNHISQINDWGDAYISPGKGYKKTLIHIVKRTLNILSFGKLSYKHTNLLFVIRKEAA